jgi:general secretion pathway protein J
MSRPRRTRTDDPTAGFTLIEALIATALMVGILAALASVTAQWLPNWNRGLARVQRNEVLMLGVERIVADLGAAQFVTPHGRTKHPLFEGTELSVTFVRTALGPNAARGLEIVRLVEIGDANGLSLVRYRAPFVPLSSEHSVSSQLRLQDPVVLLRGHRVTFAYMGADRAWLNTWVDAQFLPRMVRVSVRETGSERLLSISTVAPVRVVAAAECVRLKNARNCTKTAAPADGL